jgi:hypothetical protein
MTPGPAVRCSRTRTVLVTTVCCAVAAGCGGASSSSSTTSAVARNAAQLVCAKARGAAAASLRAAVSLTVADRDPANVECLLRGSGTRLDVVAQQSAQAWTQWDTTQVHQDQAYGPSANHQPAQLPQALDTSAGINAGWIPAQRMIFATNGTQSRGGSYVTVTVSGRRHGKAEVALANAVMLATLRVAPKGPNLTPPS